MSHARRVTWAEGNADAAILPSPAPRLFQPATTRAAEPQLASPSGRAARLKDRGRGFLSQDWRCIVQLLLSDEDVMPDTYQLNSIRVLRACIIKTSGEKLVQVHTQPGAKQPRAPRSRAQNASRVEKRMIGTVCPN